ncbi:MAG: mitochondrial fission ELM1 family protein [Pseudomonadota bacterium]
MNTEVQAIGVDPTVWIISDGKIGDIVQCRAVAGGLSSRFEERRVAPRAPWVWAAPWGPIDPRDAVGNPQSPIAPPFPDVAVVSGRRAIPYARDVKRASGGKALLVFLKNPRTAFSEADVIWAPAHDRLDGENIFSTLTSPHGLGPLLDVARRDPAPEIAALSKPMLGVVLGGVGGGARYDQKVAADLAAKIKTAASSFASVAVTPSRRTPGFLLSAVRDALSDSKAFVWSGVGENPYKDILANASALIVTADSHNMMSEALATGAGVYAYRPPQLASKLAWFLSELEKKGAVRPFEGGADIFANAPINATDEIVEEIRQRLALAHR